MFVCDSGEDKATAAKRRARGNLTTTPSNSSPAFTVAISTVTSRFARGVQVLAAAGAGAGAASEDGSATRVETISLCGTVPLMDAILCR